MSIYLKQSPLQDVPKDLIIPLLIRSFCSTFSLITVTKTIKLIPLTIFQTISNLTPFISALLAYFWLKESLTPFQVISMFICFGGIIMVTLA